MTIHKEMTIRSIIFVIISVVLYGILLFLNSNDHILKVFKAEILAFIFIISLLPSKFSIGELIFNSNIILALFAGIEATDAIYDAYFKNKKRKIVNTKH